MTPAELTALRSMTEKEIRRAQHIVGLQIPMAYHDGNTRALVKLQGWADDYAAEMMRRLDLENQSCDHAQGAVADHCLICGGMVPWGGENDGHETKAYDV